MHSSKSKSAAAAASVLGFIGLLSLVACGGGGGGSDSSADDSPNPVPGGGGSGTSSSSSSSSSGGGGGGGGPLPTGDCVVKQDILKSTTWSAASCPDGYLVKYMLEVRGAGVELHIEPGTRVRVDIDAALSVEDGAAIVAKGSAAQKIVFDGATGVDAASWIGLRVKSNNPANELSFVTIKHAGANEDQQRAALIVSQDGVLSMTDTEIVDNALLGFALFDNAKLTKLDRVSVARNKTGAATMGVPSVKYLKGEANVFADNGNGNSVVIEATSLLKVTEDTVWPSVAPAVYRVAGQNGTGGGVIKIEKHLEIEPGAVFELVSGSGFVVAGGTAGLRAVGTPDKKIIFRGVDGSSWSGITYGESAWANNRLEHVEVRNAVAAPSWGYYGTGNTSTRKAGILLGYNAIAPVQLVVKDFAISGPNNAPADFAVKGTAVLQQETGVVGTGTGGALELQAL